MLLCPHELAFESIPQVCILSEPVVLAGYTTNSTVFPWPFMMRYNSVACESGARRSASPCSSSKGVDWPSIMNVGDRRRYSVSVCWSGTPPRYDAIGPGKADVPYKLNKSYTPPPAMAARKRPVRNVAITAR